MKALLIPLDDRPVTYVFPSMVANAAGIEIIAPPRSLMGSLFHPAQIDSLIGWINTTLERNQLDVVIIGLDSILYGGLITSRRCDDPAKTIAKRLGSLKKWRPSGKDKPKIFAQTSIMRISDNYDNTEEKQYWARYGKEIFEWSGVLYRMSKTSKVNQGLLDSYERRIPLDIRDDYLKLRFRNFQINQEIVDMVGDKLIDRLIVSVDDSGNQGLNVLEREKLVQKVQQQGLTKKVFSYPGADEVIDTLLSSWLNDQLRTMGVKIRAKPVFSPPGVANCPSRYEGQTVGETLKSQVEAAGIEFVSEFDGMSNGGNTIDITIVMHGSDVQQGDHILLPGQPDLRQIDTRMQVKETIAILEKATTPCILCDVAYSNGSDPLLSEELIQRPDLIAKLIGYAGWNTTGNTIGSALSMGVARLFAIRTQRRNEATDKAFNRCMFTRLADDWAYQTRVRPQLTADASIDQLAQLIRPYLAKIGQAMKFDPGNLRVSFPWKRTFELEVCFEDR